MSYEIVYGIPLTLKDLYELKSKSEFTIKKYDLVDVIKYRKYAYICYFCDRGSNRNKCNNDCCHRYLYCTDECPMNTDKFSFFNKEATYDSTNRYITALVYGDDIKKKLEERYPKVLAELIFEYYKQGHNVIDFLETFGYSIYQSLIFFLFKDENDVQNYIRIIPVITKYNYYFQERGICAFFGISRTLDVGLLQDISDNSYCNNKSTKLVDNLGKIMYPNRKADKYIIREDDN